MRTLLWFVSCFGVGNMARLAYGDDPKGLVVALALIVAFWMSARESNRRELLG